MKKLSYLLFFVISISSCQKVINVKLNDSAQQYVIEGEVTNAAGPYTVSISRSRNFTENNDFDQITGATVLITDVTSSLTDTLRVSSPGKYSTSKLQGVPGHSYQLNVVIGNQRFTATSVMPTQLVRIDSLYASRSTFGGEDVYMSPVYTDPVGKGNYYRVRQWVRGIQIKGSRARSDEATDGFTYRSQLFYDTEDESGNPKINLNDSIMAEVQCINREVYDYFRTLGDATGDNSATPANPLTNISGGALGIFNTCLSSRRSAVARFQ